MADRLPELDISTPEKECEALVIKAYLIHVYLGGRPKAFIAKTTEMVNRIEEQLAKFDDDRPPELKAEGDG